MNIKQQSNSIRNQSQDNNNSNNNNGNNDDDHNILLLLLLLLLLLSLLLLIHQSVRSSEIVGSAKLRKGSHAYIFARLTLTRHPYYLTTSFSGFSLTRPTRFVGRVGENTGKEVDYLRAWNRLLLFSFGVYPNSTSASH